MWIQQANGQLTIFKDAERDALLQGVGYGILGMLTLIAAIAFAAWVFHWRGKK